MTRKPRFPAHDSRSCEVGYARPPNHTKFRKGKSGNPSGRPKNVARLGSVLKTELETLVSVRINGKCRDISKREAIVRRLYEKALRGDIRALEIFLQHIRKTEPAEPPYIIKIYKDDAKNPELTQGDVDSGERNDVASSPSTDCISTAVQPHAAREGTNNEAARSPQLTRDKRGASERDGATSSPSTDTKPVAEPHLSYEDANSKTTPGVTTARMRAPKPHQHFYVTGATSGGGRYSSNGSAIVENVHPDHVAPLERAGCVRV